MKGFTKAAAVVAGYVAAGIAASIAVYLQNLGSTDPDRASGAMYAFGDLLLWLAVFVVVGLVPTGMALFFLRGNRVLWRVLSTIAAVLAAGSIAALVLVWNVHTADPPWGPWASFAVLPLLVAPLLAGIFGVAGLIAPAGKPRVALAVAAAIEAMTGAAFFLNLMARTRGGS